MKQKTAFTLIELLIVLAIIGIIAAILIPVFANSKAKARQATCVSNLHQIGSAATAYMQDNNENWPMGFQDLDYMKMGTLACPSAPESTNKDPNTPPPSPRGYAYNDLFRHDVFPGGQYEQAAVRRALPDAHITFPVTTVMAVDAFLDGTEMSGLSGPDMCQYVKPCPTEKMEKGYERHSGGANYVFADSHVKWLRADQVEYGVPTPSHPGNPTNDGTHPTFAVATE